MRAHPEILLELLADSSGHLDTLSFQIGEGGYCLGLLTGNGNRHVSAPVVLMDYHRPRSGAGGY
jgi:hypothetical protein